MSELVLHDRPIVTIFNPLGHGQSQGLTDSPERLRAGSLSNPLGAKERSSPIYSLRHGA